MRKSLIAILLVFLAGCASAEEITLAAAADLNYALKDLAARFEKKTGDKVTLSFGSSGNMFSQIQSGAPYDLFFSADEQYPQKLAAAGLMDAASLRSYAVGHLVLWVPNSSGLDPQKLFEIASTSSGQCWSLSTYCPVPGPVPTSPANRGYAGGFAAALMLKDLKLSQAAALSVGAPTPLGAEATQLYSLFAAQGHEGLDFSGIIAMLRGNSAAPSTR